MHFVTNLTYCIRCMYHPRTNMLRRACRAEESGQDIDSTHGIVREASEFELQMTTVLRGIHGSLQDSSRPQVHTLAVACQRSNCVNKCRNVESEYFVQTFVCRKLKNGMRELPEFDLSGLACKRALVWTPRVDICISIPAVCSSTSTVEARMQQAQGVSRTLELIFY